MKSRKGIISIILLLSYFMGFSHEILPHCHHNSADEIVIFRQAGEQHKHVHEDHHHQHINHNDHIDHGVKDLISCLFSESDHTGSDIEMCDITPVRLNPNLISYSTGTAVIELLNLVDEKIDDPDMFGFTSFLIPLVIKEEQFTGDPRRGPPSFSC